MYNYVGDVMTNYFFKILVIGEKDNCERFYNFFKSVGYDFIDKKEIIGNNEYSLYFEGNMAGGDNFWRKTFQNYYEEVHLITEDEFKADQLKHKEWGLGFSLKDYSLYFNLNIYINAIDYPEAPSYRHFDNGVRINDSMPSIINLDKEYAENEKLYCTSSECIERVDPEEMFGEDFYKYSDPADHDGYC